MKTFINITFFHFLENAEIDDKRPVRNRKKKIPNDFVETPSRRTKKPAEEPKKVEKRGRKLVLMPEENLEDVIEGPSPAIIATIEKEQPKRRGRPAKIIEKEGLATGVETPTVVKRRGKPAQVVEISPQKEPEIETIQEAPKISRRKGRNPDNNKTDKEHEIKEKPTDSVIKPAKRGRKLAQKKETVQDNKTEELTQEAPRTSKRRVAKSDEDTPVEVVSEKLSVSKTLKRRAGKEDTYEETNKPTEEVLTKSKKGCAKLAGQELTTTPPKRSKRGAANESTQPIIEKTAKVQFASPEISTVHPITPMKKEALKRGRGRKKADVAESEKKEEPKKSTSRSKITVESKTDVIDLTEIPTTSKKTLGRRKATEPVNESPPKKSKTGTDTTAATKTIRTSGRSKKI